MGEQTVEPGSGAAKLEATAFFLAQIREQVIAEAGDFAAQCAVIKGAVVKRLPLHGIELQLYVAQ